MNGGIEFDWDAENVGHLKRHRVMPEEFEETIIGDPMFIEYQTERGEERYKVLGATKDGRVLIAVWTAREGKVRAVTAYGADRALAKLYWGTRG